MYEYTYAHTDRQTAGTAAAAYMQTKKNRVAAQYQTVKRFP